MMAKRQPHAWTAEEDAILIEWYASGCPVAEIAGQLGLSWSQVQHRADLLKVSFNRLAPPVVPLTDAQRVLVTKALYLVPYFLKRLYPHVRCRGDLSGMISYGNLALCQAAPRWTHAKGTWQTYAINCVCCAFKKYWRQERPLIHVPGYLHERGERPSFNFRSLSVASQAEREQDGKPDASTLCERLLAVLSPEQADLLRRRYLDGISGSDLARQLHIRTTTLNMRIKAIRDRLRTNFSHLYQEFILTHDASSG